MIGNLAFGVLVACIINISNSLHSSQDKYLLRAAYLKNDFVNYNISELFFDQKLDHFNRNDIRTFKQRYFINDQFFQVSGPVFLCVGGEGPPLDWTVLFKSPHCNDMIELGSKVGALLVALEHRYYGLSLPTTDFSTENLMWLNSEQALADIAYFHEKLVKKFNLKSDNKWISWGGSYPGMLSALLRFSYPHLFFGAVSSSAPLQAQVEMKEYDDIVAESLSNAYVGGSTECLTIIKEGHEQIKSLLSNYNSRRNLEERFHLCGNNVLEDLNNRYMFAGDGVITLPIQENDPSCQPKYCNIQKICNALIYESKNNPNPVYLLATIANAQLDGKPCKEISRTVYLNSLLNISNPERVWLYQTCSEWGFYQTCTEQSNCPYTKGYHPLSLDYELCQILFGISAVQVDEQVAMTLTRYGGRSIQSSRIFFINGEIDPWRGLSVLKPVNNDMRVLRVPGASHHFWTHPILDTDDQLIRAAREEIWSEVSHQL